jgi:hypothetical protein
MTRELGKFLQDGKEFAWRGLTLRNPIVIGKPYI